jgi:hypothetical protein
MRLLATMLEVNTYPGLDDAAEAIDAFVDAVSTWWDATDRER